MSEPLHIRFRADLLEPLALLLLRGAPDEDRHISFVGEAARAERPDAGLCAWHGDLIVISRPATLNFTRQSLAAISNALLMRPDDFEPSEVFVDIRSSDHAPWLCEMRLEPFPENPIDAVIYHVAEVDLTLGAEDG